MLWYFTLIFLLRLIQEWTDRKLSDSTQLSQMTLELSNGVYFKASIHFHQKKFHFQIF